MTLLGSGAILREVIAGAALLERDFGIHADIFAVTSFTELKREADACERWNMLHPLEEPRVPYVTQDACSSAATARWWRRPTISAPSPSRSAAMSRPATRCWARTASGARTIAASCAPSSRWTAIIVAVAALKAMAESQLHPDQEGRRGHRPLSPRPGKARSDDALSLTTPSLNALSIPFRFKVPRHVQD